MSRNTVASIAEFDRCTCGRTLQLISQHVYRVWPLENPFCQSECNWFVWRESTRKTCTMCVCVYMCECVCMCVLCLKYGCFPLRKPRASASSTQSPCHSHQMPPMRLQISNCILCMHAIWWLHSISFAPFKRNFIRATITHNQKHTTLRFGVVWPCELLVGKSARWCARSIQLCVLLMLIIMIIIKRNCLVIWFWAKQGYLLTFLLDSFFSISLALALYTFVFIYNELCNIAKQQQIQHCTRTNLLFID